MNGGKMVRWIAWIGGVVVVIVIAAGAIYWRVWEAGPGVGGRASAKESPDAKPETTPVTVARPKKGGIERTVVQPGTVEPIQWADLYAKVSGFLVEQTVDIGSRVKEGQVLARISVPEYEQQVVRDKARVTDAAAKIRQMEAKLNAAEAESRAADAAVNLAKVNVQAKVAYQRYREKQLARIKELARDKAVDARLLDEQEDYYQSAFEGANAAKEQVNASQERAAAAKAEVIRARADVDQAKAEEGVTKAELAKSEVLLDYTVIRSPYTGVVTRRSFHPPRAFVKAADQGGNVPLLTVERTDRVRIVVQVPDRDVDYLDVGDKATLTVDARDRTEFTGTVTRFSDAEDQDTRLMRTEIELPNPDGKLKRGMYGRATIVVDAGSPGALRVPSAAVTERKDGGHAAVRLMRDGKARTVEVTIGTDNGTETEVIAGLTAEDEVIVRSSGPLAEGTPVSTGGH